MRQVRFKKVYMNMLWPYGINFLEKLGNMSMTSVYDRNTSSNELFEEVDKKIATHLIQFGRIGYVTIWQKLQRKMRLRSMRCNMVGYASNHSAGPF